MIETITFEALQPGPTLVFLGAVHGNEPCGTMAIREAVEKFRTGEWTLKQGRVVFAPVCNPGAVAAGTRQVDRNLNRSLYPKEHKTAYEDHIDPILCGILDRADMLIDLHSYTIGHIPYTLIAGPQPEDIAFARQLGVPDLIYGWADAYAASGAVMEPLENQGTTEYARLHGATTVTVECGQHDDPNGVVVARRVIHHALINLGYIDGDRPLATPMALFGIRHAVFKKKNGEFMRNWQNLDIIKQGDLIARYDDGETVLAPHDGVILLTKPWAQPGGEWFNTAVMEMND